MNTVKKTWSGEFEDDAAVDLTASDYTATIDWGDGTSSQGTITRYQNDEGAVWYEVDAEHTYGNFDDFYPVIMSMTVTDRFGNDLGTWSMETAWDPR